MGQAPYIIATDDPVLVTGALGFIGPAVVEALLQRGAILCRYQAGGQRVRVIRGNLLSSADCATATNGVAVVFHLAAASDKSFASSYMNSVVTTRNLLESSRSLVRFVNVSSFAVYSNRGTPPSAYLDEASPVEGHDGRCSDPYCFAKAAQDELVVDYGKRFGIPYVIVRPGSVYGPGKEAITGRVGVGSLGVFLHLGGPNRIPFTYVDNCADAIVLAGVIPGVEGEVFNVVDDNLPTSRQFLLLYKRNVKNFRSIYLPHVVSYALCSLWEKYSRWSEGQLPPVFTRRRWYSEWKRTPYSNRKLKEKLGWQPRVTMDEGLRRYFAYCREIHNA